MFFSSILKKLFLFCGIISLFGLFLSGPVINTKAQTLDTLNVLGVNCLFVDTTTTKTAKPCTKETALFEIIKSFALALAPIFAVVIIIFGGYKYLQGTEESIKEGRKYIEGAAIGLVIIYLSDFFISTIQNIFPGTETKPVDSAPVIEIVKDIVGFLIPIAAVVTVFFVVIGAYNLILSNGDSAKAEKGRKAIVNAVIGLVIVLLAVTIVQLIQNVSGNVNSTLTGS